MVGLSYLDREGNVREEMHTEECLDRMNDWVQAWTDYRLKWPNFCMGCLGVGITSCTENQSPLGSGMYWPMDVSEPCELCTDIGKCARCGERFVPDDELDDFLFDLKPCPHCGWNWGNNHGDSTYWYECMCYGRMWT